MRLSVYCAENYNISRRQAKEAVKNGLISINKSIIKKDIEIDGTENITADFTIKQLNYNLSDYLLYQDDNYVFLYKPPFLHSERLHIDDDLTISDIYKNFPDYNSLSRLDYEADGIIGMINKNIKINNISKSYYAFVNGEFPEYIEIAKKIDAVNKKKVKVLDNNDDGFPAVMKKVKFNGKISLIEVTLEKAARHQVRAFSDYLNHSIIGDKIYNGLQFKRLCLHCFKYTINDKTFTVIKKQNCFFICMILLNINRFIPVVLNNIFYNLFFKIIYFEP